MLEILRKKYQTTLKMLLGLDKTWVVLVIILFVGIFLRTYNFSGWLRFNPDQARNAMVVGDAVSGKAELPLIGPLAAGTFFHLGPILYEYQYVSAKFFGNTPKAMAYPDLLFSILAIPLLYLFLRRIFSVTASLFVSSIMAVSFFFITYARFSSNPNAIPFFMLIFFYGLSGILSDKKNESSMWRWPTMIGLSAGVAVQQHTLLLFAVPLTLCAVLVYMFKKRMVNWRHVMLVILMILILNTGQIVGEIKTGGSNFRELFLSVTQRQASKPNWLKNIFRVSACQVQSNANLISSFVNIEECGDVYKFPAFRLNNLKKVFQAIFVAISATVFSIAGYVFLLLRAHKEKDLHKKRTINLLLFYNLLICLIMIPVAGEISLRYFIVLSIIPFFILANVIDVSLSLNSKKITAVIIISCAAIFMGNTVVLARESRVYVQGVANDGENAYLGETSEMAKFVLLRSKNEKAIYVIGSRIYERRYFKPLKYLVENSNAGIIVKDRSEDGDIPVGMMFFYVTKNDKGCLAAKSDTQKDEFLDCGEFGKVLVFQAIKK